MSFHFSRNAFFGRCKHAHLHHGSKVPTQRLHYSVLATRSEFEHLHQTLRAAAPALEEFAIEDLIRAGSLADIDSQAEAEEDLDVHADFVRLLQSWSAVCRDQEERFEGFFVQVGGFSFDHFDGHDTERPNIDFAVVLFLFDHFWRHPVGGADHSITFRFLVRNFGAEPEVGCVRSVRYKTETMGATYLFSRCREHRGGHYLI